MKEKQAVTLAMLRKALSTCHLTQGDKKLKFLLDVKDPSYYLHRVMECVSKCEHGEDVAENVILAIQLLNLYRVVTCGPIQSEKDQDSGTGSKDSTGHHSEANAGGMGGSPDSRERISDGTT